MFFDLFHALSLARVISIEKSINHQNDTFRRPTSSSRFSEAARKSAAITFLISASGIDAMLSKMCHRPFWRAKAKLVKTASDF